MALAPVVATLDKPLGSPEWWVDRLSLELDYRLSDSVSGTPQQVQPGLLRLRNYANGNADDPLVSDKASVAFRRLMGLSKTNLCGLVINAVADRLAVTGFRFGEDPDADSDAWRIWQSSDFDAESALAIRSALEVGRGFVSLEPGLSDGDMPTLYAEDPAQVIVAYAPGSRRVRIAALKRWADEWTGESRATLYLPDAIYRFTARGAYVEFGGKWKRDGDAIDNVLGEVPIYELRNRPTIDGSVMAEHVDVLSDQDRANHIALNALIAAEYGAFRQKWATGLEIPRDPATGQPIEPFVTAVDRLFTSENPDARFGDFNPTDLVPYVTLYESTVMHMAAVSRTPAAYMLGNIANLSAEALAAADAGLVRKSVGRQRGYESGFEDLIRGAFRAMGDARADTPTVETIWTSAEIKSDAQAADRAVKLTQGDRPIIPVEQAREDLGYSETQIARMAQWDADSNTLGAFAQTLQAQVADLTGAANGPAPTV